MNWDRLNEWTTGFYTIIHALDIAQRIDFGNLDLLPESADRARAWIKPECSYSSVLLNPPPVKFEISFRRNPNKHFPEIAAHVVKMLVQDLTVILDELMEISLAERGEAAGDFPQSKIQKLATHLDAKFLWSSQGCLELVAVRNALSHGSGRWNQRSIDIIKDFVKPPPAVNDKVVVGFPMLFDYRKAIRTFLNETKMH